MYRVVEVAELLKVSKVTIYNYLKEYSKELKPHLHKVKSITHIDNTGIELLKEYMTLKGDFKEINTNEIKDNINNTPNTEYIELLNEFKEFKQTYVKDLKEQIETLKGEIEVKNNQLENKDKLIENMQVLLKQQQEKTLLLEEQKEDKKSIFQRIFKRN
ncbi:MAG: hypothetical protein ACTHW2_08065 [Tissierella sp.]|uniref:hypothetical protein n=1 Tax=Tissierella sp. TaxID=41274 RepID=UPI003F994B88